MTAGTVAPDPRLRLTRRVLWAVPFAVAVGLGVAAAQQARTADEAAWYVLWIPLALAVAGGCIALAGPFRGALLVVLPFAVAAGVDDGSGGRPPLWVLPLLLAGVVLANRAQSRYRF